MFDGIPNIETPIKTPIADTLLRALLRLDGGRAWCKNTLAKNKHGFKVPNAKSVQAVAWCAMGVVTKESTNDDINKDAIQYLNKAAETLYPGHSTISVNDYLGFPHVDKIFHMAILMARTVETIKNRVS